MGQRIHNQGHGKQGEAYADFICKTHPARVQIIGDTAKQQDCHCGSRTAHLIRMAQIRHGLAEQGVHVGIIQRSPGIIARLVNVDAKQFLQIPSQKPAGQNADKVDYRHVQVMPKQDRPFFHPHHEEKGKQKQRLELKHKGKPEKDRRLCTVLFQKEIKGIQEKCGIDDIALAPVGAVDNHRGGQQNPRHPQYGFSHTCRHVVQDQKYRPAGQIIKKYGYKLERIEITPLPVGKQCHNIHIGRRIIGYAHGQGAEASVLSYAPHPVLQKAEIIR